MQRACARSRGATSRRLTFWRPRGSLRISASTTALPKEFKAVQPVGERIFVKVMEAQRKSVGGLVLPTSAQTAPTQGTITTVSKDCSLKVGDHVVYSKYAGTDLEIEGEPHVLLKEDDVVGLLKSEDISKMEPLGDRILVEISQSESETSAGLMLTEADTEKPTFGTVLSVGPGKPSDENPTPPNVSVGSTILYSRYSGTEFQGDDQTEYIVIKEADVLAELS